MPTQEKKFISEHGYETYGTAHEERTRREINAKFTIDKADVQAYCADAKADIESTKTSGIAQINARVATVAPMVDVKTENNVNYIFDNQADWTAGETYTLPDDDPVTGEPITVVYNPTCLYIGGQTA